MIMFELITNLLQLFYYKLSAVDCDTQVNNNCNIFNKKFKIDLRVAQVS